MLQNYWKQLYFILVNLRVQNLPEGREYDFLSIRTKPKMRSSNSSWQQQVKRNKDNWDKYEDPGYWVKQFQKIPNWDKFLRKSWELKFRMISHPRSTGCYFRPWVITSVVPWSDNICLISLNLIICLNHNIQYHDAQTLPRQPVHPPRSSS